MQQVHCNACSIFQTDLDSEFLTFFVIPLKIQVETTMNAMHHGMLLVIPMSWNITVSKLPIGMRPGKSNVAMNTFVPWQLSLKQGAFEAEALPYPVLVTTISRGGLRMIQMPKKIRMLEEFVNCIANVGSHIWQRLLGHQGYSQGNTRMT